MNNIVPPNDDFSSRFGKHFDQTWTERAANLGQVPLGYKPALSLPERLACARAKGLQVGAVLARKSSTLQHSIDGQVRECLASAASKGILVPPRYVFVSGGASGR